MRVMVSSANLTIDGYRWNQEVFGILDFEDGGDLSIDTLEDSLRFLSFILQKTDQANHESPATRRCRDLIEKIRTSSKDWSIGDSKRKSKKIEVHPIFSIPGVSSVIQEISDNWPNSSPPSYAFVTSPFFDECAEHDPYEPATATWKHLRQRGEAHITYNVRAEQIEGGGYCVGAPYESLLRTEPKPRRNVYSKFCRINENVKVGDGSRDEFRPLHLKSIWLENDTTAAFLLGSSNFTKAGLGLSKNGRRNIEANLLYIVKGNCKSKEYKQLETSYLEGEPLDRQDIIAGKYQTESFEDEPGNILPLPEFFSTAVYRRDEKGNAILLLGFEPRLKSKKIAGWSIYGEDDEVLVIDEKSWRDNGEREDYEYPWPYDVPPSGLEIRREDLGQSVWWPVIIESANSLPPPAELKDLSLEVLLRILSSARPLHHVFKRWYKPKIGKKGSIEIPIVDPHKKVDVSGFILQRTRRFFLALSEIRSRLERPIVTQEQLTWRLYGPVGVMVIARSIRKEAKNDIEEIFLLNELTLELSRVKPCKSKGCIYPPEVLGEIQKVIYILKEEIDEVRSNVQSPLLKYVDRSFHAIGVKR